ncbi:hypothetical protein [Coleofasciculus sp. FACHB-SPT9]|uniref:hypothetical protein n=1 Tax=Cyanophyceae TaxID=3028117 RepID=UPI001681E301|nr:hypothetical protein [Coleofasciculus sp. FACHB-SPT9]MBD1887969.1 hypothetical protein [Coleofasciculus sp. FACHB-SPT9]
MAENKADGQQEKTKQRMLRETDKIGEAAEVLSGKKPIQGSLSKGVKKAQEKDFDAFLNDAETGFVRQKGEKKGEKQVKIRKLNK